MSMSRYQGAALITVLWLSAALALMVGASARSVSAYLRLASVELERVRAEAVLDGAIALVAQHLRAAPDGGTRYRRYRLRLGALDVEVEATPAKGLVDVNVASDELLQALLRGAGGLDHGSAAVQLARIRDWIDPDDQPSGVGGAEAAQYRAAGWPSLPRNARIEDGTDLLAVLGFNFQLYDKIKLFLGVNGNQRVDIGAAPPALIDALTGQAGLGARLYALPPQQRDAELANYTGAGVFDYRPKDADGTVRLVASLPGANGQRWQREVWIDRSERPDTLTPWTTLHIEPTRRIGDEEGAANP